MEPVFKTMSAVYMPGLFSTSKLVKERGVFGTVRLAIVSIKSGLLGDHFLGMVVQHTFAWMVPKSFSKGSTTWLVVRPDLKDIGFAPRVVEPLSHAYRVRLY